MTETTRAREQRLPTAEVDNPRCGVCATETDYDGDGYICRDCGIAYSPITLEASIADPDEHACGKPCTDDFHHPTRTPTNYRWKCYPCALREDHDTDDCYGGCHTILINQQEPTE